MIEVTSDLAALHAQTFVADALHLARIHRTATSAQDSAPLTIRLRTAVAKSLPRLRRATDLSAQDPILSDPLFFARELDLAFALRAIKLVATADWRQVQNPGLGAARSKFAHSAQVLLRLHLNTFDEQSVAFFQGHGQIAAAVKQLRPALEALIADLENLVAPDFRLALLTSESSLCASGGIDSDADFDAIGESLARIEEITDKLAIDAEQSQQRIIKAIEDIPKQAGGDNQSAQEAISTFANAGALATNILKLTGNQSEARTIRTITTAATGVLSGVVGVIAAGGNPVVMAGAVFGIANTIIGLFVDQGPSAEQQIMEGIQALSRQVEDLRREVHQRFDRIESMLSQMHRHIMKGLSQVSRDISQLHQMVDTLQQDLGRLLEAMTEGFIELKRDPYMNERLNAVRYSQDHGYPLHEPDEHRRRNLQRSFEALRNWALQAPSSRLLSPRWHSRMSLGDLLQALDDYGPEYCTGLLQGFAQQEMEEKIFAPRLNPIVWSDAVMAFVEHLYRNPDVNYNRENRAVLKDLLSDGLQYDRFVRELRTSDGLFSKLVQRIKSARDGAQPEMLKSTVAAFNQLPAPRGLLKLCRAFEQALFGGYSIQPPPSKYTSTGEITGLLAHGLRRALASNADYLNMGRDAPELLTLGSRDSEACAQRMREAHAEKFLDAWELFERTKLDNPEPWLYWSRQLRALRSGTLRSKASNSSSSSFDVVTLFISVAQHSAFPPPVLDATVKALFEPDQEGRSFEYIAYLRGFMEASNPAERKRLREEYKISNPFYIAACAAFPLWLIIWPPIRDLDLASARPSADFSHNFEAVELRQEVQLARAFLELAYGQEFHDDPALHTDVLGHLVAIAQPDPYASIEDFSIDVFYKPDRYDVAREELLRMLLDYTYITHLNGLTLAIDSLLENAKHSDDRLVHRFIRTTHEAVTLMEDTFLNS